MGSTMAYLSIIHIRLSSADILPDDPMIHDLHFVSRMIGCLLV